MENKNSKIFGIILIIVILLIIAGLIAFATFLLADKKDEEPIAKNENEIVIKGSGKTATAGGSELEPIDNVENADNEKKKQMEGYEIIGKIEIPKTSLESNILSETTKRSLEIAITQMFSTSELNQPGNTVLYGHNYRNTKFFSRNYELEKGDSIYITDQENNRIKYVIYDKFETSSTDTTFYTRNTAGKCEITLSTCTDDASTTERRLIILAKEE